MSVNILWRGIQIEVRSEPNWLNSDITHIEIDAQPRTPLPMSETGYRSHFIAPDVLEEHGGVEAFVQYWLEEAAKDWDGQLSLL